MAVRIADSLKQQNNLTTFPVAYGADLWLDKNKGVGTPSYDSIQTLYNNGQLGGSSMQVSVMPNASAENVGKIVQYIGATGSYEHGCFYECKDESGSYVWRYISTVKNGVFYTSDNITDSTLYPVGSVAVYTGEPLWGLFKGHHYEYVEDTPLTTYKFNGTKNGETLSFFLANKELEVGSALVRISDGYIVSYVSAINGTTITVQGRTYTETFTNVVETGETEEVASYTGWIDIGGGGSDGGEDGTSIFYGTMEEWDALSTDAKKQYDYMSNKQTSGNYTDIYSTSEVKTNKVWIDNKPIYRRILTISANVEVGTTETDISGKLVETPADIMSWGIDNVIFLQKTGNFSEGLGIVLNVSTGIITAVSLKSSSYWLASGFHIMIEYTKTTD